MIRHYRIATTSLGLAALLLLGASAAAQSDTKPTAYPSAQAAKPLQAGASLPTGIVLKDSEGADFSLTDRTRGTTTVLIIYRGGWCPYCVTHLGDLGAIRSQLEAAQVQVLGISPDSPESIREHMKKQPSGYTLLSDSSHRASKALGIAFTVDQATQEMLKGYNIDLAKASGNTEAVLPVPSVFVINEAGKITYQHSDPDYKKRLKSSDVLAALGLSNSVPAGSGTKQ